MKRPKNREMMQNGGKGLPARSGIKINWQRAGWLLIVYACQLLYFPVNRLAQGGVMLNTPLDDFIPLQPFWVAPYLLCMFWWVGCFAWAAWKLEDARFKALVAGTLAVMLFSYVIYLVYPTYVTRPELSGDGWAVRLLAWVYGQDRPYNAFPSSHTYLTMLIFFFWRRWLPRQTWLWGLVSLVILCSTLFTRQHYLPDLLGGIALAWLGYRLGLGWSGRQRLMPEVAGEWKQ